MSRQSPAGPAVIARVAADYRLGEVLIAPAVAARGQEGLIWRVSTERGAFAIKELLEQTRERDAARVAAFQAAMLDRGVPAPRPLRTGAGALLVSVEEAQFRAYEWVDLQEPRRDGDPAVIGRLMARLHRDPLPAEPTDGDGWYDEPVPAEEWQAVSECLTAGGAPFATAFAASIPEFCALQSVFRPSGPTQLCHRDLWADNLRFTVQGRPCVIDWDNCGPAEAVQELAMPLVDFCYRDGERAARLYRAYLDAGGPGRFSDRSDFTMVLAQFGHFALAAGQQWLEARDDGERARAEARFREGHEAPFGLHEIDHLLRSTGHRRSVPTATARRSR